MDVRRIVVTFIFTGARGGQDEQALWCHSLIHWEAHMAVMSENSADATAIRPFTIPVTPEAELEALRTRVAATRCPIRSSSQIIRRASATG